MQELRELHIDLDEIAEAMDLTSRDTIDFFLDMQTGEIIITGDVAEGSEEIEAAIDAGDVRFENIPENDSRDGYSLMEEFIATLGPSLIADRLQNAIIGKGAFGRFRRVLETQPDLQQRWWVFEAEERRRGGRLAGIAGHSIDVETPNSSVSIGELVMEVTFYRTRPRSPDHRDLYRSTVSVDQVIPVVAKPPSTIA